MNSWNDASMPVWVPKDKKIFNLLTRVQQNQATVTEYQIAQQLSRYKQIRKLREKDQMYIGMDRRKGKSIIYFKKPLKRKGNGFLL